MERLWRALRGGSRSGEGKETERELNRSTYSLVSCGDVTPQSLQLWLTLPDEIKNDPDLDKFRKLYDESDKSKFNLEDKNVAEVTAKRLHMVPLLDERDEIEENKNGDVIADASRNNDTTDNLPIQPDIKLRTKISNAKYYTKMTLLLGCWLFFTVVFLTCNEKKEYFKNTAVSPGLIKNYTIGPLEANSILVKVSGPFLSENAEIKMNSSELETREKMVVWLETWNSSNNGVQDQMPPDSWTIFLEDEDLDFNAGEERSRKFDLQQTNSTYALRVKTTGEKTVALALSWSPDSLGAAGVVYACVLLCGLYVLIIFEIINRTMAAILVSTMSIAALALVGERPSLQEIISWLDEETLLLLFSMMLLVAIMAETGIFDYLAVFAFEVTGGRLWSLVFLLCGLTAVFSTFLDNVTTVLLMSPVTIRLCEVMDLDPVPILMLMAIYSNIGGTATPVGDPPNVIVASNKAVIQAGINFSNFTMHMALGIVLVCAQTSLQVRYMFRDTSRLRLKEPRHIQDLRNQISIWRRAAESLPHLSKDVQVVRERLQRKVDKLHRQLQAELRHTSRRACPEDTFHTTLLQLKDKYKIRDKTLLLKASVTIAFVVVVFFLHSVPEFNRVSLSWTALLGAILLLLLADRADLEPVLHRVEWSTLLFFAALFVLMEALSRLGLISFVGGMLQQVVLQAQGRARLALAILLILWVSGMISAFVDNIPLTTMMVRVVVTIGSNPAVDLPLPPLIWALLFGACLGGNGTLIGASANVVCAGVAEQHGYRFSFLQFFRVGFPVMIGHLLVASLYLLLCHCVFTWH
ncbi:P protein [Papilio machaon]|uniref:P protein n=1 Tax=Papilio machaon TaxID=76193 RepID=UPI001E665CB2|nr:P protein [Papilio machaon]XP_014365394.2 P protein [Papilio machaon]XP_014365401.2 P protein [Papilio machaon]XP_045538665.1 P protein [Papilio machaon]